MPKLKIYSFIRNIANDRFDYHYIRHLIAHLKLKGYEVEWADLDGNDGFIYKNDCEVLINQGSITIFEFENKTFKTYDFGDVPNLTIKLSKSKNFIGAAIGQYNVKLWDEIISIPSIRKQVVAGSYPESYWQFGVENYDSIQQYRNDVTLSPKLYWRGSIYENPTQAEYNCRASIKELPQLLGGNFFFGNYPIPFDLYIKESINYKLSLCCGVGGGYLCGDHCLRDIEMYGIGVPTIRPVYAVKNFCTLIPNEHYVAVDLEFDDQFRYKNPTLCAEKIASRYKEVINDDNYLKYVVNNARKWYIDNISYPNIINNIITSLKL